MRGAQRRSAAVPLTHRELPAADDEPRDRLRQHRLQARVARVQLAGDADAAATDAGDVQPRGRRVELGQGAGGALGGGCEQEAAAREGDVGDLELHALGRAWVTRRESVDQW